MFKFRKNLRKGTIIFACLAVTTMFAACDSNNPNDDDDGGNGGNPAATANDITSVKALVGGWFYYDGWSSAYLWKFESGGNYARFKVSQSGFTNNVGTTWYSAYGNIMTGKYRVNGYVIECYNNQHSSQFAQDFNIGSVPPHNTAVSKLPPLNNPSPVGDFTLEFEFFDAMTLRLVSDRPVYDDYDGLFDYYGEDSHNVTIPTHQIPSKPWPKDLLPPDFPEYGSGGRVKNIVIDNAGNVMIYIDRTTLDTYVGYINLLLQEGWSFKYSETIEDVKKGYLVSLKKGDQELMVNGADDYVYGEIRIIFYP